MRLIIYDFEVYRYNWCVVFACAESTDKIDFVNGLKWGHIEDDPDMLHRFYDEFKDAVFVGYNSNFYDQYIMRAILGGINPYDVSSFIIESDENKPYQYPEMQKLVRKYPMIGFDVMGPNDSGLKALESSMGTDIHETKIPFDINRRLTQEEMQEVLKYCAYDVLATGKVFNARHSTFTTDLGLVELIIADGGAKDYTILSKSETQLAALMLGAKRVDGISEDAFKFKLPENLDLEKYKEVYDWYADKKNRKYYYYVTDSKGKKKRETNQYFIDVSGAPHVFGYGGIHGSKDKYSYVCNPDEVIVCADVASLYPSYLIIYNALSRGVKDPDKYEEIYVKRLKYKADKNPAQAPLKLVLNKTTGGMKTDTSDLYDPMRNNQMCVSCQLYLLDLAEHLERASFEDYILLQSNTDAVYFKIYRKDLQAAQEICKEWMDRTGFVLEFNLCNRIYQKDVNNYLLVTDDGKIKTKGSYVKEQDELTRDLPAVRDALVEYMMYNTPIEDTIKSKNSMMDFIFTTKASNKYVCAVYGNERLNEKCNRIFASLREEDKGKGIFKIPKSRPFNPDGSDNLSKFSNSPESVFIDNSDIRQKEVPDYLDKEWYIWFAIKRLKDFGIDYVRADGVLPPPPPPTKTELAQMAKFEACKKFFEENGHLKPKAKTIVDDINISSWLNTIKKNFKDGKLSAEDIDRYTAIGMDFTVTAKGKTKAKVVEVEDTIE